MKRRRSKIARLPKEIRDGINGKLEEGVIYREICRWLGEQGYPGISEVAMTRWFKGGHADWLAERRQLEELKLEEEFAQELVKQGGLEVVAGRKPANGVGAVFEDGDEGEYGVVAGFDGDKAGGICADGEFAGAVEQGSAGAGKTGAGVGIAG
ncbi:MAG: hypothetical protein JWQ71_526 [Pedosphaera sp.]|nr:hypothetical protein [Pedosphaera sp.]